MALFDSIADYYEALSDSTARLEREGPLLRACLDLAPGRRVVDVACGTGLHARFFADLGAEVAAFDLSPEMAAFAQERRPHPSVRYAAGDMRAIEGGPWDLAVCLGNSLSLLGSIEEIAITFATVFARLSPGGIWLVQVLNYAAPAAHEPRHRVDRKLRGDTEVIAVKNLVPHGDRTLLSLAFYAMQAGACSSASEAMALLNVSQAQIAAAAECAGFRPVALYGGFDRSEYCPESSQDIVALFQKPGEPPRTVSPQIRG